MIVDLILYFTLVIITIANKNEEHQHIPFFVMQPHTIINQTLHSYCKEQYEFNIEPMCINLTQWPSGFIYARNPQQKFDDDYDLAAASSIRECTTELHASFGDRIRIVFYPIGNIRNDYDQDYFITIPKAPCLRIRDEYETTTFDCPMMLDRSKSTSFNRPSDDYLSNSNTIYLEMIQPPILTSDYDDSHHQFKLFFTTLTPKFYVGPNRDFSQCPNEHLFDCEDSYCVHPNARCNGINECRSKMDEELCPEKVSDGRSRYYFSYFLINVECLFISIILSTI